MKGVIIVGLTLIVLLCAAFLLQPEVSTHVSSTSDTNTTAEEGRVTTVPEISAEFVVLPVLALILLMVSRKASKPS
jgi:preprotein translocase subunit SecG